MMMMRNLSKCNFAVRKNFPPVSDCLNSGSYVEDGSKTFDNFSVKKNCVQIARTVRQIDWTECCPQLIRCTCKKLMRNFRNNLNFSKNRPYKIRFNQVFYALISPQTLQVGGQPSSKVLPNGHPLKVPQEPFRWVASRYLNSDQMKFTRAQANISLIQLRFSSTWRVEFKMSKKHSTNSEKCQWLGLSTGFFPFRASWTGNQWRSHWCRIHEPSLQENLNVNL